MDNWPADFKASDEGRLLAAVLNFNNLNPDVITYLTVLFHFIDSQKIDEKTYLSYFKGYVSDVPEHFSADVLRLVEEGKYQEALDAMGPIGPGNLALRRAIDYLGMLRDVKATMELPGLETLPEHEKIFHALELARVHVRVNVHVEEHEGEDPTVTLPNINQPMPIPTNETPAAALTYIRTAMLQLNDWVQAVPDSTLDTVFTISAQKSAALTGNKAAATPLEVKQSVAALVRSPILAEIQRQAQRVSDAQLRG